MLHSIKLDLFLYDQAVAEAFGVFGAAPAVRYRCYLDCSKMEDIADIPQIQP
jgi:hypothetical protein